jgi:hypothetical protein
MKNISLILVATICLFANISVQSQNTKQRMSFKSITIQNGDTIITEKNLDSDDPNANLSDSIPFGNGSIQFHFGDGNSDDFFMDFDNFQFPNAPFSNNPFLSDSLFNQFFSPHFMIDSNFNDQYPFFVAPPSDNNSQAFQNLNKNNYNLSEFKVAVLPEINKLNITFKLSPSTTSVINIVNEKGESVLMEQLEKSDGYYVHQIDLYQLQKGKYTITLNQGVKRESTNVFIN